MKNILLFVLIFSFLSCFCQENTNADSLNTGNLTKSSRQPILIINSFNAMAINGRSNKKDLFRQLTDSLSSCLFRKLENHPRYEPIVIPNILNTSGSPDTNVYSFLRERNAAFAIVILSLDAFFNESGSREETDDDGKPVTITSYDICNRNVYNLYGSDTLIKRSEIENCEFLTSRSTRGRFSIRFGPDIVGKKKHAFKTVANNASAYIHDISFQLSDE